MIHLKALDKQKKTCNEVDEKKENTKRIESNVRERMRKERNGSELIEEKEQKGNKSEHIEKEKKTNCTLTKGRVLVVLRQHSK